jgi:hypothetical protein
MVERLHMSGLIANITYEDMADVTASDSAAVPGNVAAGFGADVAGTITFTTLLGSKHTRTILAGLIYNIAVKQIWSTGTTATGLYVVYQSPYFARSA